jgi:hypothetical protein
MSIFIACASPGISAFFTASGPFLGLSRVSSAAVASTLLAGEIFLAPPFLEQACNYLDHKGYLPKEEKTQIIAAIAIHIITATSLLWGGMYCASAALSLASFSIEPFSLLAAFASTAAATTITVAAIILEDYFFPED